ncbi:MAG: single-stranded DNA-binding protein [Pedobacter sp.]|nr:single-stranded DNA-binding protein [Pedobacter sp.]MDQ8054072.1 single-stranded DNA-binding protein [Pedobacter sp.]
MENVVNKVMLSGCAGADAEVKIFGENQKLARVNLAVNEHYRNSLGEDVKKTQWFTLTFWNTKADLAEAQIKKGTWFAVEGRLQTNNYEAKDGTKRYATEIVVNEVEFKTATETK